MEKLIIEPFNITKLDDIIKPIGSRLDIYFYNKQSKFTAIVRTDTKNRVFVFYSEYKGRTWSDEVSKNYRDYSKDLDVMCAEYTNVNNIIAPYVDMPNLYKIVVGVDYIPELKGINIKTAGYVIGHACLEAVYGDNKSDYVDYILSENTYRIEGEQLKMIANRFLMKDIEDSCNLGYLYYNKTQKKAISETSQISWAEVNTKRFGIQGNTRELATLMKVFTDFVPIGFNWATYTPIWCNNKEFLNKIQNESRFGLDWLEVKNLTKDGNTIQGYDSVTYYTTKRRMYEVFKCAFDHYNFRFINEIMAGLFLGDKYKINTGYLAINPSTKKTVLPIEFESMLEDSKASLKVMTKNDNANVSVLPVKMFMDALWKSMHSGVEQYPDELLGTLANLTLDTIHCDVQALTAQSAELFGYV